MENRNKNCTFEELDKFQKELPKGPKYKWIFRGDSYEDNLDDTLKTSLEKAFENFEVDEPEKCVTERDIIREFQRKLHLYVSNLPARADIIQWLALMQHHGAPTRLLDWTYSFWVAVHFAVMQTKPGKNAVIWAVNTKPILDYHNGITYNKAFEETDVYNNIVERKDLPYCEDDAIRDNALVHNLIKDDKPALGVFASSSFRLNQRITIQQGTFLIVANIKKTFMENLLAVKHHNKGSIIEKYPFTVTKLSKLRIAKKLMQMNINNAVLFPGLDGFSESLWTRVGLPMRVISGDKLILYP